MRCRVYSLYTTRAAALGACTSAPPPCLPASASARAFATTITKYVLGHSSRCLDAAQLAPSLICSHVSTCRCPSFCAEQLNNSKRPMALTQSMIPLSQTFENLTVSWNERDELLEGERIVALADSGRRSQWFVFSVYPSTLRQTSLCLSFCLR